MMKRIFVLMLVCLFVSVVLVSAQDGIPDNCENPAGEFYQENLFARVTGGGDVELIDWNTGITIRTLLTPDDGENTFIGTWSPNCAYLTGSQITATVDTIAQYRTLAWDARTGALLTTFEDARRVAHPITWSDNSDYLLVEGRNGALVWRVSTNTRVQLSSGADGNAHTFFPDSLVWDYEAHQLSGTLVFERFGTAIYSLDTGELLAISDRFGRALDVASVQASVAVASDEPYRCVNSRPQDLDADYEPHNQRIILHDITSNEVIKVVETNVTLNLFQAVSYSPTCQYMRASVILGDDSRETTIIWDLWHTVPRRVVTVGDAYGFAHRVFWSPDSNYVVLQTRADARLIYLTTGASVRLTADLVSDCYFHMKGCGGRVMAFHYVGWDFANNLLQLDLIFGNIVKYDLSDGSPVQILDRQGNPVSAERENVVRQRLNSPHGCTHSIFYHATNDTLALKDWLTGEEILIVDNELDLWSFEEIGYSPTCTFIAARVGLEGESSESIMLWNLVTGERLPNVAVDEDRINFVWSQDGNTATLTTSDSEYIWNLSDSTVAQQ
jgi:hypothetical protein